MKRLCLDCGKGPDECRCDNPVFETVFEHAPHGLPVLNEEQHKALVKEMNRKPTPEEIEHLKKIRKQFDNMAKRSREGKILVYYGEIIKTPNQKFWCYDYKHDEWIEVTPPKKDIKYIPVHAVY